MIRILVDSASDYTLAEAREKGLDFVSISVAIGDTAYHSGVDASYDELYEAMMAGKDFPKTSQPSPEQFLKVFEDAKAKGDEVIYIALSSALSGTCQSGYLAKRMADYDKIHIVDTLTVACGIRILAEHALELREAGMSAEGIAGKVAAIAPRVRIAASLDTLEYLRRGGRLSAAAAAVGTLANLKPVVYITADGKVSVLAKCMGKIKAQKALLDHMQSMSRDIAFPMYTIYSYGTENCEKLEEKIAALGERVDERQQLGLAIGAHVGPGAAGFVFVEKA